MPRPNRYHPYSRGSTAPPAHNPSQHYATYSPYASPPPTNLRVTRPRPRPRPSTPTAGHLYQPISSDYIRGFTCDGKNLVTRSVMVGPDGTFYVQMAFVRYPSEMPSSRSLSVSPNLLASIPEHGQGLGVDVHPRPSPIPVDPRLEQVRAMLGVAAAADSTGLGLDMQMQMQMKLGRREALGEAGVIEDLIAVRPGQRDTRRDSAAESERSDECALLSSDGSDCGDVDADGAGSVDEEWGILMEGS
ncbi:hypothetical protein P154DRAFT_525574 [Amniculicola lignicola CBS 123094]|uniref:Uncharacterized protein n=1 Tax=Amniculicola lignicola CBS 123094 TaxID=1392246 RepID=A0A6A5W8K6_9PLEO|nr:hypothetical protein P154DRAFT_525574 [Amniculicola lignicola CBS 123094]